MSDVSVTLPDGSSPPGARRQHACRRCGRRSLRASPRPRSRPSSTGAGGSDVSADEGRACRDPDGQGARRAARLSAQHGPPAGRRGHQPLSVGTVRHRSGDRRGLLLRLRRGPAVRAGGPRRHREEDEGAGGRGPAVRAPDVAARGGDSLLHGSRRAAQGSTDRGEDRRSAGRVLLHDQGSRTRSSTSASGRTCRPRDASRPSSC